MDLFYSVAQDMISSLMFFSRTLMHYLPRYFPILPFQPIVLHHGKDPDPVKKIINIFRIIMIVTLTDFLTPQNYQYL
jgi:hypothetical protein